MTTLRDRFPDLTKLLLITPTNFESFIPRLEYMLNSQDINQGLHMIKNLLNILFTNNENWNYHNVLDVTDMLKMFRNIYPVVLFNYNDMVSSVLFKFDFSPLKRNYSIRFYNQILDLDIETKYKLYMVNFGVGENRDPISLLNSNIKRLTFINIDQSLFKI
jgi:hypothetical protein